MKAFVNFLSSFRIMVAFLIIPTLMMRWYWISLQYMSWAQYQIGLTVIWHANIIAVLNWVVFWITLVINYWCATHLSCWH